MDDFVILGAFIGSSAYIAKYRIYLGRGSEVLSTFMANFCFGVLFGRVSVHEFCFWSKMEKDSGVSMAIGGLLSMLAPWLMDRFLPDVGKKLLSAVKSFNLKSLILRMLGVSEKK